MPLRADFHDILIVFVYNNLPLLLNPVAASAAFAVALNAVDDTDSQANAVIAAADSAAGTLAPANAATIVTPELLNALQAAALNQFQGLGLPGDIEEIAQQFFVFLPPITTLPARTT